MQAYKQIAQDGFAEIVIKQSRFICYLQRITTEEEALTFIQSIKKEHPKATHHCAAFLVGDNDHIQRAFDDGEPSGTAGVPILEVLKRNALHYVVAVVVRYFGGVKLGTGGLIRAYGSAVSHTLTELGLVYHTKQFIYTLSVPYHLNDKLAYFLDKSPYHVLNTFYTDVVTYECGILHDEVTLFESTLQQQYHDKIHITYKEERYVDIPYTIESE